MNILVVTLSNFGDVILTTPVIMALVKKFPEARITVVVGPRARSVLQRSPDIHKVVIYDKKAPFWQKLKFITELRKATYDFVVDLRNTAIPFLVSCKKRTPLFRKFTEVNMRHRHLEVLGMMEKNKGSGPFFFSAEGRIRPGPCGGEKGARAPFQFFNKADEIFAMRALEIAQVPEKDGWILVAPGAASGRKRWPAPHFKEVIRALHAKTGKRVLLAGTLEERPVAEELAAELPGIAAVLCGDLIFAETAAIVAKASLVISNDSAIMHLGFELGTPTVGIFGPTDHEKYGHEGPKFRVAREDAAQCPCGSEKLPRAERSCFHGLKPEKVTSLCLELLKL